MMQHRDDGEVSASDPQIRIPEYRPAQLVTALRHG